MRYLVANWKMNKTIQEVRNFFATSREALRLVRGVEIVFCPPYPLIPAVRSEVIGTPLKVGAQNLSGEEEGAFTGEVSGKQIEDLVDYVIVGHSERKKYFHETDKEIANKLVQARRHGLTAILCFENYQDLAVVNDTTKLILAYEPTFAIGSGHPDTPSDAAEVARHAKEMLGAGVPVLYGGSVNPGDIKEFLKKKELAGFLVGAAALDPASFVDLAHAASV